MVPCHKINFYWLILMIRKYKIIYIFAKLKSLFSITAFANYVK